MPRPPKFLRQLTPEQLNYLQQVALGTIARAGDSPRHFAAFYQLIFERELPEFALADWVPALYEAREAEKGFILQAFRGSSKTTTITIAWLAFQIGHQPEASYLLVQGSGDSARENAGQVAEIIADHPGWRLAFPYVRPDRKAGWAQEGYHVMRVDMDYTAWGELTLKNKSKDPSLLGVGYRSRALIGKHPTGGLLVDDLHDEFNSRDGRELETVKKLLLGTLLPAVVPGAWRVVIGTPWSENDSLQYLMNTGEWHTVRTPIFTEDGAPQWDERFSLEAIEKIRQQVGSTQFARMYLLDVKSAAGLHLKREWLGRIPLSQIDPRWPVVMGVDYASAGVAAGPERDYCAIAIGRVLPDGAGVALIDGFRGQLSQGAAEAKVRQLASVYPSLQLIGVEAVGKGEEFFHLLLRGARLPLRAFTPGRSSKAQRFELEMAPLFEFHRAWLADVDTPFLRAFEAEWVGFPQAKHDDTLDAVYWMLKAGAPWLFPQAEKRAKKGNPFLNL